MEGKWERFLPARKSAAYLLGLLEDAGSIRPEFSDTLRRRHLRRSFEHWGRTRIPIGYLAAHGARGRVFASCMGRNASLADVIKWIGVGRGKGRVLLLGTCLTLGAPRQARDLVDQTGLVAVFGYRRMVDTVHAAVWDMLLLDDLAGAYRDGNPGVARLRKSVERLEARYPELTNQLGFVSIWRAGNE